MLQWIGQVLQKIEADDVVEAESLDIFRFQRFGNRVDAPSPSNVCAMESADFDTGHIASSRFCSGQKMSAAASDFEKVALAQKRGILVELFEGRLMPEGAVDALCETAALIFAGAAESFIAPQVGTASRASRVETGITREGRLQPSTAKRTFVDDGVHALDRLSSDAIRNDLGTFFDC